MFLQEGATASDVRQGNHGDCWFLAALCTLCNKKDLIERVCVAKDEDVGVYGFVFHRGAFRYNLLYTDCVLRKQMGNGFRRSLTTSYTLSRPTGGRAQTKRNIPLRWSMDGRLKRGIDERNKQARRLCISRSVPLKMRHGYLCWRKHLPKRTVISTPSMEALQGVHTAPQSPSHLLTYCSEATEDLTGGVTTELFTTDIMDKEKFWTDEMMKVNDEFLFGCDTGTFDNWQGSDVASRDGARDNIIRMHTYSIMEAREIKGQRLVKLRNPWGEGEWKGAWSDGSEQWTPEWMTLLNHRFGDDGIFWISYEDLLRRYQSFDRTRLFGPDWRITQQWTEVDVPWSADYNSTKFSITLTKRSPIVIVLSQLDDRYFQGLVGQYTFQLHFRLEKDGEDDYIVRSHGNYSMRRSVSTDLELDPGTYSVLMRITAKRDRGVPTPENIIRSNVRDRQNKVIQVGLSYDLAHAKGDIVETGEEKTARQKLEEKKKAAEKKKRREARSRVNRKKWEYGKREKARERRHTKKREAYERKKAEAQKVTQPAEADAAGDAAPSPAVNGADVAVGVEGDIEKQAAIAAVEDTTGEPAPEPASLPSPPAENQAEETKPSNDAQPERETSAVQTKETQQGRQAEDPTTKNTKLTESNLQSIPQVTINGDSVPISTAPLASNAPPSTLAPGDDYQYDSDASYTTSIDSVLDFYPTAEDYAAAPDDGAEPEDEEWPPSAAEGDVDADAEFENDPWNAVCVVGLKVYSKDEGCCVQIIRPKEEEETLDLDDASKGASGEVEGVGK